MANYRLIVAFLSLLFGTVLGPFGVRSGVRLEGAFGGLFVHIVGASRPKNNPNSPLEHPPKYRLNGPKRRDAFSRQFATPMHLPSNGSVTSL